MANNTRDSDTLLLLYCTRPGALPGLAWYCTGTQVPDSWTAHCSEIIQKFRNFSGNFLLPFSKPSSGILTATGGVMVQLWCHPFTQEYQLDANLRILTNNRNSPTSHAMMDALRGGIEVEPGSASTPPH